jgi:hypothetical protein
MERLRTKKPVNNKLFHAFASELVGRVLFANRLEGQQYGTDRDLYEALGYKKTLTFDDFLGKYLRQDMAKAIVDRPVKATWQGTLELVESEDPEETPFEKEWRRLDRRFKLKTVLSRVDRLTRLGRYGVLLLGLDDVKKREDLLKPVSAGKRKLLYVKPFSEKSAKIQECESNPKNKRYGLPLIYELEVAEASAGTTSTIHVHYSRVIHVTEDLLESEVYGTPVLEAVFNRLMDMEKLVGGDAEMFWRGARPGFQGNIGKDYQMSQEDKEDLLDQIDEYEHNLRRIIVNEGLELKALAQQIADPEPHADVILMCISAVTGIPKRILSGSERGELSSGQDATEWKTYVQSRREDHAEPNILRQFADRLIELGVLPAPADGYTVNWLDLFSISEKDRVEIGQKRSNALREYTTNATALSIVPPEAFFEYFLGLTTPQIQLISKFVGQGISEDQKDLMEEMLKLLDKEAAKPIPEGKKVKALPAANMKRMK